ncbi:hypothetical protein RSOLAG1IB_07277 [Rhizoctonia solani AG-1 IB]|uniref:Ricin B lectin domain-containing protein n=1 Tax=Thanatephorus cucumeris (strain AG1-IB / isolate 7/3/14) TaxID=1108050 RepID=M5CH24_THACB|nr:hypothetical protein BN14_11273 [Rhizoctonia solani AG-1 IB]CEL54743.1 hypothetical protein RSOLAG1IB_07277 [Rhizoctonia solani AG-1 IB]
MALKLPDPGIYRIKHVSTGSYMTRVSETTVTGSPTNQGKKSQWRLSPAANVYGGYHLTSVESDKYFHYNHSTNEMHTYDSGLWCIEKTDKNGEYYLHAQWNHLVAKIDDKDKTVRVATALAAADEKWTFEVVQPLDKTLPPLTIHQYTHYPFTPGQYVIRNVSTGTVLHANDPEQAETKVVGHQANNSDNQKWKLLPTRLGNTMGILSSSRIMTGLSTLQQSDTLKLSAARDLNYVLMFIPADKGFWIAPVANPYLVYDLTGANSADGTEICLWPKNDLDHQKWHFDPL